MPRNIMFLSATLITTLYKSRFRNKIINSTENLRTVNKYLNKELTASEVLVLWGYVRMCLQVI